VIDAPSIFKLIRKTAALVRVLPTFPFNCEENVVWRKRKIPLVGLVSQAELLKLQKSGQFPDEPVRIKV
jgi:hypothetical protein